MKTLSLVPNPGSGTVFRLIGIFVHPSWGSVSLLTSHHVAGLPILVAILYYLAAFLTSMESIIGGKVRRPSTENILILLQKWDS